MNKENQYNIYYYKILGHYYLVFIELPFIIAIDEFFYYFLKTNKIKNAKEILANDNTKEEYKIQISNFIKKIKKSLLSVRNEEYESYVENFEKKH